MFNLITYFNMKSVRLAKTNFLYCQTQRYVFDVETPKSIFLTVHYPIEVKCKAWLLLLFFATYCTSFNSSIFMRIHYTCNDWVIYRNVLLKVNAPFRCQKCLGVKAFYYRMSPKKLVLQSCWLDLEIYEQ